MNIRNALYFLFISMATEAIAGELIAEDKFASFTDKIVAYNPNFFGLAVPTTNDPLKEEEHLEFYLSIEYPIYQGLHFVYNGLFDFYVLNEQYKSSPVLSRIQNPGISYKFNSFVWQGFWHSFELGWFHESNGQSLELANQDDDQNGIDDALDIFNTLAQQRNLIFAINEVSRGWDYFSLRYRLSSDLNLVQPQQGDWLLQTDLRLLCDCQLAGLLDKEDEIWWDQQDNAEIAAYDGLRLRYDYFFQPWLNTRVEFKTGLKNVFKNRGGKLAINAKAGDAWLSLFYFDGFGKEPASYHLKTSYVGFGIEFE